MEGLIKGLINVALGDHGDNNNNNNNNRDEEESNPNQSRDERSISTWAQVVSSGGDQDSTDQAWNSNRKEEEEREEGRNEEWQTVGGVSHSRRRPQKVVYAEHEHDDDAQHDYNQNKWNRKEEEEGNSEDWETVGRRPPERPQKIWMDHAHGYKRPPSEQEYSDEVGYGANIEPSEEELVDLSQACNKLWELDSNRLIPGKDYEIVCGEGKKVYQNEDMAEGSLFNRLSKDIFRRPTYSRFCSLLDNYNPVVGSKEEVTTQERQEQAAFIEEISRTAPIKYLHKYLTSKGIVSENCEDFKRMMTDLWFGLYGRGGASSTSSAFEHVFVGEIKTRGEDEVSGFHNWLQFYLEEAKGRVNYQGYIFPRRRGEMPDSETQLLTIQFEWNGVLKSVSSTLVGVSPEFEIALYTLCFFMGGEDNHVQIGPYPVNIKIYRLGNDKIGSAFPIAEC
ncbi:Endoribonuclease XendoU [Macleaya cordata]|uniref:Endoribonuclease XendoU n=1 Tax=Macleaya cordata TaxID=56857 RepID=A0A200Q8V6_MACCD|nr:Endoribonuclease XendoU [Macleaya cordata]